MKKKVAHPNWTGLYILSAGMLGIFLLEARADLTENTHRALEILLAIALFALIWIWLSANEQAMLMEDCERFRESLQSWDSSARQPQGRVQPDAGGGKVRKSFRELLPAWLWSAFAVTAGLLHHKDL